MYLGEALHAGFHLFVILGKLILAYMYMCTVMYWNLLRHPDAHQRPTFNDLLYKLQTNASTLLRWEEKDNTGPEAATLGAPLQYGATLHQDLQQRYQL